MHRLSTIRLHPHLGSRFVYQSMILRASSTRTYRFCGSLNRRGRRFLQKTQSATQKIHRPLAERTTAPRSRNLQRFLIQVYVFYVSAVAVGSRQCAAGVIPLPRFILCLFDRCPFTDNFPQKLKSQGTLNAITDAMDSGKGQYSVSQLGIPGLRHFVYKSRPHVQITFPIFEDPYDTADEKRRFVMCR